MASENWEIAGLLIDAKADVNAEITDEGGNRMVRYCSAAFFFEGGSNIGVRVWVLILLIVWCSPSHPLRAKPGPVYLRGKPQLLTLTLTRPTTQALAQMLPLPSPNLTLCNPYLTQT